MFWMYAAAVREFHGAEITRPKRLIASLVRGIDGTGHLDAARADFVARAVIAPNREGSAAGRSSASRSLVLPAKAQEPVDDAVPDVGVRREGSSPAAFHAC